MTIDVEYEKQLSLWEMKILTAFDSDCCLDDLLELIPKQHQLRFLIRLADDLQTFSCKLQGEKR